MPPSAFAPTTPIPPATPPAAPTQPQGGLDPGAKNLAIAIRQVESGGKFDAKGKSGEYGAYQWTPSTWAAQSKAAGVNVPLEQATPEQQNQVAYTAILSMKNKGLNVGQIASTWNSGKANAYLDPAYKGTDKQGVAFDVPGYAKKVAEAYQTIKSGGDVTPGGTDSTAIGAGDQTATPITPDQQNAQQTGAFAPADTANESMISAPLKALANIPSSAFGFLKGIVSTLNPVNIIETLGKDAAGFADAASNFGGGFGGFAKAAGSLAGNIPAAAYHTLVPQAAQGAITMAKGAFTGNAAEQEQGRQTALRNIVNDPVGSIAPLLLAGEGAAEKAGVGDTFNKVIENTASPVTKAASAVGGKMADVAGGAFRGAASKLTGLEPETMSEIAKNPDAFTKEARASASRENLGSSVQSALDTRSSELADTGKGYQPIRDLQKVDTSVSPAETKAIKIGNGKTVVYDMKDAPNDQLTLPELRKKSEVLKATGTQGMGNNPGSFPELKAVTDLIKSREASETIPHQVKVSPAYLERSIKQSTGLTMEDGQFKASGMASIRDVKDVRGLQKLYDTWKPSFAKGYLTTDEFLNFRSDLADMAHYDREVTKSAPLDNLGKQMRSNFNDNYRSKIPGLEELDNQFSTQKGELKELSRGLVDKNGEMTDAGLAKIANLSKDKPNLAAQLEKLVPGIGDQVKILKAIRDIQKVEGPGKVGTYTKTAAGAGGAVAGLATGNIPLMAASIAEMILTSPENATNIIRKYGASKPLINAVVAKLKGGAGAINNAPAAIIPKMVGAFGPKSP